MQRGFAPVIIIIAVFALIGAYFVGATVGKPNFNEWFGPKGFIRNEESLKDLYGTQIPTPVPTPASSPAPASPSSGLGGSTSTPKTQAIKLAYNLPTGWKTAQDANNQIEIGYNPETNNPSTTYVAGAVSALGKWAENPTRRLAGSYTAKLGTYDGGSRHKAILGPDLEKQGWEKFSEYHEKEYIYNTWSCLVLYGIYVSQSDITWGMCAVSSTQAIYFSSSMMDEQKIEQAIQTIKLLKTP